MNELAVFDAGEQFLADIIRIANEHRKLATAYESKLYRLFGLVHYDRDPGFPCWQHKAVGSYYDTPRQALEAAVKGQSVKGEPYAG